MVVVVDIMGAVESLLNVHRTPVGGEDCLSGTKIEGRRYNWPKIPLQNEAAKKVHPRLPVCTTQPFPRESRIYRRSNALPWRNQRNATG